ncbi:hypothetical protein GH714_020394 [Hevea brasiliensis]|uniref:GOLD domain-containing protein n=1 Tax=Hevea brasiliensis TaxID=3981 RepID=A0A6A6K6D3_HEVBR|nr:hypothetical protein GH714_020394 [Hevea brasiliensis]
MQVTSPADNVVHSVKGTSGDKFEFKAPRSGMYKFCFTIPTQHQRLSLSMFTLVISPMSMILLKMPMSTRKRVIGYTVAEYILLAIPLSKIPLSSSG